MSIRGLIRSTMVIFRSPAGRVVLLTTYYLVIIAALILMYGEGDFSTAGFVYQGF